LTLHGHYRCFSWPNKRSIYWKLPPPPLGGGKYQPMSFGEKNIKSGREKRENVKEKGRKGK
jgi:hypothetical protein